MTIFPPITPAIRRAHHRPHLDHAAFFLANGVLVLIICAGSSSASAHEAWLLTPAEVAELARQPLPTIFTAPGPLALAAFASSAALLTAVALETRLSRWETRLSAPLLILSPSLGPLLIRLGLAAMMALGALGGLPRHGTAPWSEPTLFVPDMQLALVPGWDWLAPTQFVLALLLGLGVQTRLSASAVLCLSLAGLVAFGQPFLSYAPHFAAPALVLLALGGGPWSVDRFWHRRAEPAIDPRTRDTSFLAARVLLGLGFVYLAIAHKFTQPTLLMAIFEHGEIPTFGLPLDLIALAAACVELIVGLLLVFGRLVRPTALLLIGLFTFFAVTLGETPLFHANLYALAAMLVMTGPTPVGMPRRQAVPKTPEPLGDRS